MAKNLTAKAGVISAINKGYSQAARDLFNVDRNVYIRGTEKGYQLMQKIIGRATTTKAFKNEYIYTPGSNMYTGND